MKIGCCVGVDETERPEYGRLRRMGYDYVELPLSALASMDGDGFSAVREALAEAQIGCEACNCFFPADVRLTGRGADNRAVADYAEIALGRARELGAQIVVLGSAGARNVPEGFSRERALEQLASCCRLIAPIARKNGITIVMEPLNRKESNLINTVEEGLRFVESVHETGIELLADFYHMAVEHEDFSVIRRAAGRLKHIHVGGSAHRETPDESNRGEFEAVMSLLGSVGYQGRVSIEAAGDLSFGARILKSVP